MGQTPVDNKEEIRAMLLRKDKDTGNEIQMIETDSYQQLQVTSKGETPDPRVAGPKIIFDSRLDKFSTPTQSKEHIKEKQQ